VHFFDLARWVMQSDAKSVFARGQRRKLTALGVETYDSVQTQVEFQNSAVVTFDSSWILPEGFEAVVNQGIRLVGTQGVMEVDSQDRGARACFSDAGMQTYNLGFMQQTTGRGGRSLWRGYGIECIADFADNIAFLREGGQAADLPPTAATGEDGLEATKIACAAEESLRTGMPVET
jgi:predicted dehydrogenase